MPTGVGSPSLSSAVHNIVMIHKIEGSLPILGATKVEFMLINSLFN